MSEDVVERKAYYIGEWKGNVVSDNIIQQLRVKSEADRGKKVKVRISKYGIQIRKSSMFQGSVLFDSYRMEDIYFITVNQQNKSCLLCIVRDEKQKYSIMAFRCASDYDAGLFMQTFKALKSHSKQGSYEMTRKGDGNWTLRSRSAGPTRQYLQVPKAKPANGAPNGDIRHVKTTPITNQTMLPDPDHVTKEDVYMKGRKQHNVGVQTSRSHDVDIDQMSEASDVSAFKGELESLSQELREIKYLLEKSTGISAEEYLRRSREEGTSGNNNFEMKQVPAQRRHPDGTARVYVTNRPPPVLVSNPVPITSTSDEDVFVKDADYRSYGSQTIPGNQSRHPDIKTSEVANVLKREFSNGHLEDTTPRVMAVPLPSGDKASTLPSRGVNGQTNGVIDGHVSGESSVRVKFDPQSMRVPNDQKTRSMRMSSDFMVPSTVEKPIEKTYARPTILRPGYVYGSHRVPQPRRNRPQSLYIMSGAQPLKVQNPKLVYEAQF